ncbi:MULTISPECIES: type VI secretion system baseplate subunit TssK [Chromobacterium]|uniref:Type VI secretion system baseplate subunit TssK n=1 Tax=Chromobacterium aquaticum TaxID=467180 RepID=A0ABV9A1E6_9NEIS|nr:MULTISPECIES: type VI secretion system baseplate subunit TssK [Chromobacterium]KMN35525.1 type VI secretion protein [Chromobacterium sp. LK1]MCD5363303.1 type VI secretion system baseplate subunit TssK [Chromobacterium aquaticum]
MQQAKRVLWGEGMFLRPQHFQQQALLLEQHLSSRQQLSNRHAWGVQQITLDEQALKGGTVRIDALSILFRDGTLYQAPVNAPLPLSRDLNTLPQAGIKTTLYACLAHMQPYGGNTRSGEAMSRPTRFQSANVEVADLYTQALDADLSTLELDVRLMIEEENRDGYDAIPLCRLEKDATGQWSLAGGFIPPLVTVEGSREVSHMLRRLLDILLVKNQALSGGQRERAKNVMEYSSSDISSFWLLHTVNRNFAKLRHLSLASPLHPEELYLALAEFCGELQTFSTHYTLSDIPAYRHDDLHTVLPALDAQIRELLETVISSRYAIIPLHSPKPSFYIGRLESDRLLENVDYYLSVQSELPASQIIDSVPLKMKIGAPDDVEKILNSAMRGVALSHAAQTPSAIPVRVGNHYFALEPHGEIFSRMLQSRSICIYMPQTLSNLTLELIAVFR